MPTYEQQVAKYRDTLRANLRGITPTDTEEWADDQAEARALHKRGDFDSERDIDWLSQRASERDERGAA